MVFPPLFRAGIAGNLAVEYENTGFQLFNARQEALAVLLEQAAALVLRRDATAP